MLASWYDTGQRLVSKARGGSVIAGPNEVVDVPDAVAGDFSETHATGPNGERTYVLTSSNRQQSTSVLNDITDLGTALQMATELEASLKMRRTEATQAQMQLAEANEALLASQRELAAAREQLAKTTMKLVEARSQFEDVILTKSMLLSPRVWLKTIMAVAVGSVSALVRGAKALVTAPFAAAGRVLERFADGKRAAVATSATRAAVKAGVKVVAVGGGSNKFKWVAAG